MRDANNHYITLSNPGTALDVQVGSTLALRGENAGGTRTLTLAFSGAGNTATIAGTLILDAPPPSNDDYGAYDATNSTTTVTGTIKKVMDVSSNQGGVIIQLLQTLIFGATGTISAC